MNFSLKQALGLIGGKRGGGEIRTLPLDPPLTIMYLRSRSYV